MPKQTFTTIDPKALTQSDLHNYLLSAVAPRPICLASTIDLDGNVNLSPFSFFNVFSSNPPIMIFSPARRSRDNTTKHTYENILKVKEVVINIVNHAMIEQVSLTSTEYDRGVNEFVKAGFTQQASDKVAPPRVKEAPVAFECTVDKVIALGDGPGAGNLIIARVVLIHIHKRYLNEDEKLDTRRLDLVARMGENWYCRVSEPSLFEIPKPLRTKGIGVDRLPTSVRKSDLLTGNELARLGNLEALPSESEIEAMKDDREVKAILSMNKANISLLKREIYRIARQKLSEGKTLDALKVLLVEELY